MTRRREGLPVVATDRDLLDRLEDLHRRHRRIPEATDRYYTPGEGYRLGSAPSDPDRFAICLTDVRGATFSVGDSGIPFALQSLAKVMVYGMVLSELGRGQMLRAVGVEPSGDAFNSLLFDEYHNRPFNPMVNAGALATTNLVPGEDPADRRDRILAVLRAYAGNDALTVDEATYRAEQRGADRNRATAYLMRSDGMLTGDVEACLSLYLQQCSVLVDCRDLSVMAATLANGGVNPVTGRRALDRPFVRDVLSVMYTCGMYDFAGEWAYSVGIPAKSGVSGGVLAVVPGKMGIGIFSPGLDRFGNSARGTRVCQDLSERLGLHVFATETEDELAVPVGKPAPESPDDHR